MMRKSNKKIRFLKLIFDLFVFREFDSQGQSIVPYIQSYLDAGIKYIGGCCHVNPNQIRAMRNIIDEYRSEK